MAQLCFRRRSRGADALQEDIPPLLLIFGRIAVGKLVARFLDAAVAVWPEKGGAVFCTIPLDFVIHSLSMGKFRIRLGLSFCKAVPGYWGLAWPGA